MVETFTYVSDILPSDLWDPCQCPTNTKNRKNLIVYVFSSAISWAKIHRICFRSLFPDQTFWSIFKVYKIGFHWKTSRTVLSQFLELFISFFKFELNYVVKCKQSGNPQKTRETFQVSVVKTMIISRIFLDLFVPMTFGVFCKCLFVFGIDPINTELLTQFRFPSLTAKSISRSDETERYEKNGRTTR